MRSPRPQNSAKLPPRGSPSPTAPGRTLTMSASSSGYSSATENTKYMRHDPPAGPDLSFNEVDEEPLFIDSYLQADDDASLTPPGFLHEDEDSSSLSEEDDDRFDDLPEDNSPIHRLAPLWGSEIEKALTTISIVSLGKPRVIDVFMSDSARRRTSVTSESQWPPRLSSHSRQTSGSTTSTINTVSLSLYPRSRSDLSERTRQNTYRSTPASSISGRSMDSRGSSFSETPRQPTFLDMDPYAERPKPPQRTHLRSLSRTLSRPFLVKPEDNKKEVDTPPKSPTNSPRLISRTLTERRGSEAALLWRERSARRKNLVNALFANQGLMS